MTIEQLINKRGNRLHWFRRDEGSLCPKELVEAQSGITAMEITTKAKYTARLTDVSGEFFSSITTASNGRPTRTLFTIPIAHQYGPAVSSLEAY